MKRIFVKKLGQTDKNAVWIKIIKQVSFKAGNNTSAGFLVLGVLEGAALGFGATIFGLGFGSSSSSEAKRSTSSESSSFLSADSSTFFFGWQEQITND